MSGKVPNGQVEVFCRTCGRSCGFYPAVGWNAISDCIYCQMGDGFDPESIGLKDNKFYGRDVGTTTDDLRQDNRPLPEPNNAVGSGQPPKEKKRLWMKKKTD